MPINSNENKTKQNKIQQIPCSGEAEHACAQNSVWGLSHHALCSRL